MTEQKTPGQVGFEKWAELMPIAPGLNWQSLPTAGKAGWEEIAEAVIAQYEDPKGRGPIARDMDDEEYARFIANASD